MSSKKKNSSSEKQLKATVKRLEAKLRSADTKAASWKKKARRRQTALAASQSRVTKLERKLAKAMHSTGQPAATEAAQPASAEVSAPTPDAALRRVSR